MTYTVLTIFFYFIWYIIQTLLLYKLHYYWNKRNGQYWIYQVSFNAFVIRWRPWWYAPRPSPKYSCRKSNWCIIWLTYAFLFLPRLAKKTVWLNLMTLHSEKKLNDNNVYLILGWCKYLIHSIQTEGSTIGWWAIVRNCIETRSYF